MPAKVDSTTSAASRHTFEDHVGEIRLRLEAPTLPGLFEEAARGLADLIAETTAESDDEGERKVAIRARDAEALLVAWLNELIFLTETRGRVYADVRVSRATDTELEATVHGAALRVLRTAVKAATLHGLAIQKSAEGFTATIVLDV